MLAHTAGRAEKSNPETERSTACIKREVSVLFVSHPSEPLTENTIRRNPQGNKRTALSALDVLGKNARGPPQQMDPLSEQSPGRSCMGKINGQE
ncbi:unnamed protein product [Rangifer tarandus platyrhynchus]|uniref:Uncharacterized protein n=2 Tax=Rangifer tarandus platyrhynchus TaxID=3082113 RepID=A0ABN8ZYB7_RANTA|nr:unnamed protein product [Rangifer tarandus platyrhynchus]CAI9712155.1 unnamed protein product [Rangifer tarandus platyrhynchus]